MAVPSTDPCPSKEGLRRDLRKLRQAAEIVQQWCAASCPFVAMTIDRAKVIGLYMPLPGEPDPFSIGGINGKVTSLPARANDGAMVFRKWSIGDPLVTSAWGVAEPLDDGRAICPDVILVPLLGFDAGLNRIGQGGGHYDRYLANHTTARRIGLAWEVQRLGAIEPQVWDVPLDAVITEQRCYLKDFDR